MQKTPIIRLKSRLGARVRAGAPWAFSNEIVMDDATKKLPPGTEVMLAREDGSRLGGGYFNSKSLIAIRVLTHEPRALDADFFAERLKAALVLRERFYAEPYYRLVHAEGDGLPGLVIDRFADTCVVQVTTAGMELLTPLILQALNVVVGPSHVILRNDAPSRALEGLDSYTRVVKGQPPSPIELVENGVRYFGDVTGGQKTGWYYDQRETRAFAVKLARDARVLDVYCYTGGFGVLAAKSGASEVALIDSSEPALAFAARAAQANDVSALCRFVKADAMEELEKRIAAKEHHDLVVCDPPPFVRSRKDLEAGARAYRKLARLGASVTAKGGFLVLASCSHNIPLERFGQECALGIARAGREARLVHQASAGVDHPVHPMLPESAYLKSLVYALD